MRHFLYTILFSVFLMAYEEKVQFSFPSVSLYIVTILIILLIIFSIRYIELKKINRQLKSSIHDIEAIMNSTVEGIIISEQRKCIDMNISAMELFQIQSKEQFLGKSPLDFVTMIFTLKQMKTF